jgi:receptor protein-tyrosine kinase
MSAEPSIPTSEIPDEEIHKALVLLYRLSNEAVESINDLMHKLKIRFADAALHTGVVTQDELDKALDWIQHRAVQQGRGIIEEVLRRRVRREVVLWQGNPLKPSELLLLAHDPGHPRSESIRSLRTELLLRTRNQGTGVLALLSPCAGEGRSQLSAELAIAFAQLGRRTLLVDADLRRPRQHTLFGAENLRGLTEALVDSGAINLHGIEGLPQMALLTSGVLPRNPLELLAGIRFERLIAEWRRSFEFVVFDTPPAAESSDAITVAAAAGQVLILSRANMTPFNALKEMSRKLETTHARTLGAVIGSF